MALPDPDGEAGDVEWNFEKFLVSPDGAPVGRFRSMTPPDDPALIAAIEGLLTAEVAACASRRPPGRLTIVYRTHPNGAELRGETTDPRMIAGSTRGSTHSSWTTAPTRPGRAPWIEIASRSR